MALGTKTLKIIAALNHAGDWQTHEELYNQSAALRAEFNSPLMLSRRLSDLYSAGHLERQRRTGEGERLQYAYKSKTAEVQIGPARTASEVLTARETREATKTPETSAEPSRRLSALRQMAGLTPTPSSEQTGSTQAVQKVPPVAANPKVTKTRPASDPAPSAVPASAVPASSVASPARAVPTVPPSPAIRQEERTSPAAEVRPKPAEASYEANEEPVLGWEAYRAQQEMQEQEPNSALVGLFSHLLEGFFAEVIRQTGPALRQGLLQAARSPMVQNAIQDVLQSSIPEFEDLSAEPEQRVSATETPRVLPKVLIVGLLGQQAEQIRKQFGTRLNLSFWNGEAPNKQLQALLDSAETVIGATKFISHAIDGVLTRAPDYQRMHGGVSKLRLLLQELARAVQPVA